MDHFYAAFVYGFISLFSIVNPIGMSAVFLAMTRSYSDEKRHRTAYLIALYGTILLMATFFIGPYVLRFFGISLASIQVAGGALVFATAWGMLDTKPKENATDKTQDDQVDNTFFPLTMPITAGAGSIAVTIDLAAKLSNSHAFNLMGIGATLLAIVVVFVIVAFCYRQSDWIFKKLGRTGTSVVSSLTAFILLAISVTVIWDGILGLITPLMQH
jgi:multiple antibiotic resistance protein